MGADVYIFGSRALGHFEKFSDIDILFDDSRSLVPEHELYFLKNSLEESDLPYKVDLVRESELAFSFKIEVKKQRLRL